MSRHWDPRVVRDGKGLGRMRRRRRFNAGVLAALASLLLGLMLAFGAWYWVMTATGDAPDPSFSTPVALRDARTGPVRVIDGDTFDYRGMRVRIADIDTPEVDGRCPRETELAARATRRMRALLGAGPFELHRPPNGRDEDRYGRKLRIVTRDGSSLGDQLVAEGLARTWTGRREPWC